MFIRTKPNKSGLVSVQVIDKSKGRYKVVKTIGSSKDDLEIKEFVKEGKRFIQSFTGVQEFDFTDYRKVYSEVLSSSIPIN